MPRDALLLDETIEACRRIVSLTAKLNPELPDTHRDLIDALLWNFTVLGEASGQVSDDLKNAHPELPWADPVRLRNRIVHGYWSVEIGFRDLVGAPASNSAQLRVGALRGRGRSGGRDRLPAVMTRQHQGRRDG